MLLNQDQDLLADISIAICSSSMSVYWDSRGFSWILWIQGTIRKFARLSAQNGKVTESRHFSSSASILHKHEPGILIFEAAGFGGFSKKLLRILADT